MEKSKKPFYTRWWFILVVVIAVIGIAGAVKRGIQEASDKKAVYTWPGSTLVSMIPQPDSKYGRISMENESYFSIDVYKVSKEDFEKYIGSCQNSGFMNDYMRNDNYYSANHQEGHSLSLTYDEKEKTLTISLSVPDEESGLPVQADESSSPEEQTGSEETGDSAASKESEESSKAANTESQSETDADIVSEPAVIPDSQEPEPSEEKTSEGVRPEFKEVIDGYEAFMNEYYAFMKKYTNADSADTVSMVAEYAKLLQKEMEWADKIAKLESEEMNEAEVKYYAEVTLRVSQKAVDVLQ